MFFSFDGIDGAGKSTQMDLFCHWLEVEKGLEVVRCREPGSTPLGEKIRDILLNQKQVRLDIEAEMFLFMASRAQLVNEVIRPALDENKVVVCDRFQLASVVYQGYAGGMDPDVIRQVGEIAVRDTVPDLTFVFLLEPEIAVQRVGDQTDRIESRSDNFLQLVDAGFRAELDRGDQKKIAIDAALPIDRIQLDIQNQVLPLLVS